MPHNSFTAGFGRGKFGHDFFPYAKPNPDNLVSDLTSGTSVAVLGLLRIGKTSLLAETRERLRTMGKNVIWVNLDAHDTLTKALTVILYSLQESENKGIITSIWKWAENTEMLPADFKTTLGALISGAVDNSTANFDENYVDALYRQTGRLLGAQELENKPIIIFDELTTPIKNTIDHSPPEETRLVVGRLNSFLGLLRDWRTADVGISMAVSGSVSFNWLKQEYGIRSDSINDCVRVKIEELNREEAKCLLEMCIESKSLPNWSKKFTEELLDFLPSYYPGVVQLAFKAISDGTFPITTLDETIRDKINEEFWNYYFNQFSEFFQRYSSSEQSRINKLFDALDTNEGGKIDGKEALSILNGVDLGENELNGEAIIIQLKSDSFINIVFNGIRFASGLVRAWHKFKQ